MTKTSILTGFLSSGDDARTGRAARLKRTGQWVGDGFKVTDGKLHVAAGKYIRVTSQGVELDLVPLLLALDKAGFLSRSDVAKVGAVRGATGGTAGVTLTEISTSTASFGDVNTELGSIRDNQTLIVKQLNTLLEAVKP